METDEYGTKRWYNSNGVLHRGNDLHVIENVNGNKCWYVNGNRHRDNGLPAIEFIDGEKHWYVNGNRHRDNDLPAIEFANGMAKWYIYGKLHRLGGLPAIKIYENTHWYIYGKNYSYEQVCNNYKTLKGFGRYCLKKIRMRRLKRVRWIHGELLCMPAKGSYPGGQDYHKMVSYIMSM
jgi:hypothetical protein